LRFKVIVTLISFLAQLLNFAKSLHFAKSPLSHPRIKYGAMAKVAHPLPLAGEGMIMAIRDFNPLSRWRERVGKRGAISISLPISLSIVKRLNHAK
jgi:hypothetical protein